MNIHHDGHRHRHHHPSLATRPQQQPEQEQEQEQEQEKCGQQSTSNFSGYDVVQLPFNVPFGTFAYSGMAHPPIPPLWSTHSQHQGALSYAALRQSMPFVAPTVPSPLGSNAAVDALSALPYTAPALPPTASGPPPLELPAPNNEPPLWGGQMNQMSGGHLVMPTPIALPFAQPHSGTAPELSGPLLQYTASAPQPPFAPPLPIESGFTGEQHVPDQSQFSASDIWCPWTVLCPEIVVDCDPLLSPIDHPDSARSRTSSISSHDPSYLFPHQSPTSSSSHHSPHSDLSVVTPGSFISMFDFEQNMLSNLFSHPKSSTPDVGSGTRPMSALSAKSAHEDHTRTNSEADSFSNGLESEVSPYPNASAFMGPNMFQGLGQRNSSENASDSTLRLSLGQSPHSEPTPAFPVAQAIAASPNFDIPETIEDHDDDPVPEYTETAPNTRRRKGEAISSVPLRQCFMGDPLRRTLILRILAKPWLREHKVEPVFLSQDDDVTRGLEKQVAWTFGMKKGDSLFKAFEGEAGNCPFDGCPNIEPRAHRRISHVRSHFGLRPFSCDPRGCARCQARIERGLEVRRFYNPDGLREHSQPLELTDCTECGDRVLRNNMDRHLETKHGITRKRRSATSRRKASRAQRQR